MAYMQVFTSDHALKLDWIPNWIAIIGSGYIGLEFSDVYTALGSEVTFIEVMLLLLAGCCLTDLAFSITIMSFITINILRHAGKELSI